MANNNTANNWLGKLYIKSGYDTTIITAHTSVTSQYHLYWSIQPLQM